jgi:tRNA (cmo5U34)-methyltransferase
MGANKDEIFRENMQKSTDFVFNEKVAGVFDDMVSRSVPYYREMQRMAAELAADHARPGTNVYDLGCSTGTTLIQMDPGIPYDVKFIGVDDSADMLEKCRIKLMEAGLTRAFDLQMADLNNGIVIHNASVVILCLTLQFVRPINREKLVKKIFDGLVTGGVMIIFEKILAEDSDFNRDFIKYYYNMKRRKDYSELEISQKREALENVLIPYKQSENMLLMKEAGFQVVEIFFKWYNFSGFIAKKTT